MNKLIKLSGEPLCVIGMIWFSAPAQAQDRVVLGAGVAVTPTYQGSDDYRVLPLPTIDIKKGWFFANLRNGIGIEPIDTGVVSAGVSAVFVQGIDVATFRWEFRNSRMVWGLEHISICAPVA